MKRFVNKVHQIRQQHKTFPLGHPLTAATCPTLLLQEEPYPRKSSSILSCIQ
jgi:hypothetical protein